jgi:hypothetical protein
LPAAAFIVIVFALRTTGPAETVEEARRTERTTEEIDNFMLTRKR